MSERITVRRGGKASHGTASEHASEGEQERQWLARILTWLSGQNYHLRSLVRSRAIFTAVCFCALCLGTPKFTQAWGPLSSHDCARRARERNSHAVVDVLHVVMDGRPSIGRRPERRDIVIGRVGDAFKPKIVLVVEPRENRAPAQAGVTAMGSEA